MGSSQQVACFESGGGPRRHGWPSFMKSVNCYQPKEVQKAAPPQRSKNSYRSQPAHTGFFLEIFVRKFKHGNQQVLVQNWVKNMGINKCSLSKNLKNGPKLQL